MKPGDRVLLFSTYLATIERIDARCTGGQPCPCCGFGVAVVLDVDPEEIYGVSPTDCAVVEQGSFLAPGGEG